MQLVWRGVARSVAVPLALMGGLVACSDGDDPASVSFVAPIKGAAIAGGVDVELAAEGVTIEPAGEVNSGAGHFHVIADQGCVAVGDPIPRDVDHVHLGKGQPEGVLYLGPGTHELCVQVGDGAHVASDVTVTVEVGIDDQEQWCSVVEQIDARFDGVDSSDDEFAVKQADYAGIGRLLDQLISGLTHVEAGVRADVRGAAERAQVITDALVDAADEAEAEANLEAVFATEEPSGADAAAAWILDTCDVDIDG